MANDKKPVWKDWRLWAVIAVVVVIGAMIGGGKKEGSSPNENPEASTELVTKGKEYIESGKLGSATIATEKCAILKTADLNEDDINDPTYNIGAFFGSDCMDRDIEKTNSDWETRKNETIKDKTLETYLYEWAANLSNAD